MAKARVLAARTALLMRYAAGKKFDDAIGHGSRALAPAAKLSGVKNLTMFDYEHVSTWIFRTFCDRILIPRATMSRMKELKPQGRWVPFDGFQNVASIDGSAASLRSARATRTQVEQQTWLAVRTAWLAIEDARRRLDLTKLAVTSAEENLQLAQGLFEVGRSSSLELTDAQISLAQARADDVQAHADEQAATAGLERAIGVAQEGP